MYFISKITPTKKIGFNNIYIHGNYLFTVSDFTLAAFKLKENLKIEISDIEQILTVELTERFKNYCLNILGSRPRSEKEISSKLNERIKKYKETWPILNSHSSRFQQSDASTNKYNNKTIRQYNDKTGAIARNGVKKQSELRLEEKVQDELFNTARNDAIDFLKKYNYLNNLDFASWLVNQRLNQGKGKMHIKQDLLKKGITKDITDEVLKNISFSEIIKPVYEKALKKYNSEKDAHKKKQRIYRYLLSKGFSYDEIYEVLKIDNF